MDPWPLRPLDQLVPEPPFPMPWPDARRGKHKYDAPPFRTTMDRKAGVKSGKLNEDFDLDGMAERATEPLAVEGDDPFDTLDGPAACDTVAPGAAGEVAATVAGPDVKTAAAPDTAREYRERLMRLQAEFDNYRKFMENQMAAHRQRAGEDVICDVLEVADNLERALQAKGDRDAIREGVRMVAVQMQDMMARWGVREIPTAGSRFDPELHEAVERVEDPEANPGSIVKVFRKGYTLRSNVIRHARVAVAGVQKAKGGGTGDACGDDEGEREGFAGDACGEADDDRPSEEKEENEVNE